MTRRCLLLFFGLTLTMVAACGPRSVGVPDARLSGQPTAIHLADVQGTYAEIVSAAVRDELTWTAGLTPVDKNADFDLTIDVETSLEDEQGQDLLRERVNTGDHETITVRDPFVNKDFKVYRPITVDQTRLEPFVNRTAQVALEYALTSPHDADGTTGRVQASSEVKYGGVNQNTPSGPDLQDLPPADQTIAELAREAAQRLIMRLSPSGGRRSWSLAVGEGFGGNDQIMKGVELARQGHWDEAEKQWQGLIDQGWTVPDVYYNLGVVLERRGGKENLAAALDQYSQAARTGNNPLFRDALTRVTRPPARFGR